MDRLNPKKNSGRYHVLILLKKAIADIAKRKAYFGRVIDYGAKNSPYKSLFLDKSEVFHTADLSESENCDILLNSKGEIPVPNNSYDTLISSQVLEHVENVLLYLSEAKRVLKSDGTLILSTHGHWMYHPDPNDYWRWTKNGLIKTLETNGFEVIQSYGIMSLGSSGLQFFQDAIKHKLHWRIRKIFFRLIAFLQNKLDAQRIDFTDAAVFLIHAKSA